MRDESCDNEHAFMRFQRVLRPPYHFINCGPVHCTIVVGDFYLARLKTTHVSGQTYTACRVVRLR